MKCPLCSIELTISEKLGIEIDYCHKCRGFWLDRGELDKIIERSAYMHYGEYEEKDDNYRKNPDKHKQFIHKRHKQKSFLEELVD